MRKLNNNGQAGIIAVCIIIAILIIVPIFVWFQQANCRYEIKGTVEKKWIDVGDDESYYLLKIRLQDGSPKMLEVNRNILHGSNYNPDFVYSDIEVNHTYVFTCWGWDWQWSGIYWYPLVIIAEEV